jgi:hypothetical protein
LARLRHKGRFIHSGLAGNGHGHRHHHIASPFRDGCLDVIL